MNIDLTTVLWLLASAASAAALAFYAVADTEERIGVFAMSLLPIAILCALMRWAALSWIF